MHRAVAQNRPVSRFPRGCRKADAPKSRGRSLSCEILEERRLLSASFGDILPGMRLADHDLSRLEGQLVYLDFEGARDVTYDGPVRLEHIDVPAFRAPCAAGSRHQSGMGIDPTRDTGGQERLPYARVTAQDAKLLGGAEAVGPFEVREICSPGTALGFPPYETQGSWAHAAVNDSELTPPDQDAIIAAIVDELNALFADLGVAFTSRVPAQHQEHSTVYIGGDGSPFAHLGVFAGLAEKVDVGNRDRDDVAFVFPELLCQGDSNTPSECARSVAGIVAHEVGHLLGFAHDGDALEASEEPLRRALADVAAEWPAFTVVAIPDTQHATWAYPAVFVGQIQWIADNHASRNIAFVTHEGDITDNDTDAQWAVATRAMYLLDGNVRWGTCPGNHDATPMTSRNYDKYLSHFGPSHFSGQAWYGGSFGANSYQFFDVNYRTFMVMHLEYSADPGVVSWAKSVLDNHPQTPTIVTTHDYMTYTGRTSNGSYLWNNLIKHHPQIFMVLCGHYDIWPPDGSWDAGRMTSYNVAGKPVFELQADYQYEEYRIGGAGYLRLIEFLEDENRIDVRTYSPVLDSYLTIPPGQNEFSLDVDFADRFGRRDPRIGVFGNGQAIATGDTTPSRADGTDFGQLVVTGGAATHTFTIVNSGNSPLSLTGIPGVEIIGDHAGDFTVIADPSVIVAPGGSTAFQIRFDPREPGLRTATVRIANDDADRNPYEFAIQGFGGEWVYQWASSVIAYSSEWSPSGYSAAQALGAPDVPSYGDRPQAWTATSQDGTLEYLTLGYAQPVYADGVMVRETWGNGFVTKVELRNTSSALFETVWAGVDPSQPGAVAEFWVTFSPRAYLIDAVRVTIDTSRSPLWEEVDAVQLRGMAPLASEIEVQGNGKTVASGDRTPSQTDGTDFGQLELTGGRATHIFTIRNLGNVPLNLTGSPAVQVAGMHAADFTIVVQPVTPIAAGGWASFQVEFQPTGPGLRVATVRIYSDDADENPYEFSIQGVGGQWVYQWASSVIAYSSQWSPNGYSAAQVLGPPNVPSYGDRPQAWTASQQDGTIEYLTLGFATPVFADGVMVRETWGNGFITKVEVRNASSGLLETVWAGVDPSQPGALEEFWATFVPTTYLVDAVRITIDTSCSSLWEEVDAIQLRGVVPLTAQMSVKGNGQAIARGDTTPSEVDGTDFGEADVSSSTVTRTFAIENSGTAELNLTGLPLVEIVGAHGYDFSVVVQPTTPVAAGGSTTFQIRFDPSGLGLRTATVRIYNDDRDENPYEFAIQGVGGQRVYQWASSVIAYSSEWSPSGYSAAQALGAPNVPSYGDRPQAWTATSQDGTLEYLTLGFAKPVYADAVMVRETWGNGFVTKVEVRNATSGLFETVWAGVDSSQPGAVAEFWATFTARTYLVDAVRITIDTSRSPLWEEIDAVQLRGV